MSESDYIRELEARCSSLTTALEAIIPVDATPRYEYGEARPDGTKPPKGQRWNCPREIAEDALRAALARLFSGNPA